MTLSLPASAFEPVPALRRGYRPRPSRTGNERIAGIAVAGVAHLAVAAALVFGVTVARTPAEKPIFVTIVKQQSTPEEKLPPLPKLARPSEIAVPPPLIEIAPPPTSPAVTAVPPRPVASPPPINAAPAQVEQPWSGQADYVAGLLAYLERFKQYPGAARAAHVEGVVFVHFVMTRDGTVKSAEISKSSGRPLLDREALAMIARAGRLPPMPLQMKGDVLDGIIGPISFTLR